MFGNCDLKKIPKNNVKLSTKGTGTITNKHTEYEDINTYDGTSTSTNGKKIMQRKYKQDQWLRQYRKRKI